MKRLSDEVLLELLNDLESARSERKASFTNDVKKKARQTVCAFANDVPGYQEPGVLFIGAKDNGEPSHIPITDELLRNLNHMKSDGGILPFPMLSVEKRVLKGAEMAVVTVLPSDMPPIKYDGRIWVRTGPNNSLATAQEERILIEKRRLSNLPFDLSPIPTANLTSLSRSIFENEYLPQAFAADVLEQNGRTYEEQLASCRLIASPENTTPTVTGILAVGKNPQDFLPGAYIQFLRIGGKELGDPVMDEEVFAGTLVDMLRRAEEKLKAHNVSAFDITSKSVHSIHRIYPQPALQQMLYNAVLHRTYESTNAPIRVYWFDDRIEINSPGGPFGNVGVENFGLPGITDYRNPNIADVLKTFGFIQAFGFGIPTARRAMKENGNPPIEFLVNQSHVVCILRRNG